LALLLPNPGCNYSLVSALTSPYLASALSSSPYSSFLIIQVKG
jgi:hypothetical protein